MFEKSLSDLVRGIRAHKGSEHHFIAQCMTEIKKELKTGDMSVKANAISKLTYLQMMGYDISWAAFNIIEVMSSTKFTYKRIGYLGASQCFHQGLDIVMLTTNMIRKDISASNQYDAALALNGLSNFITPDLARDLANDVLALMSSSRPLLRKKSIYVMYKVFLAFPDSLRPAFPRLKDKLEDPDIGVQSAAVSVICELARKNPHNYLSLAPTFFKLMTSSTNNWMLIKIIKLFGALMPLEPRLGKKLVEPLTNLIHSTTAMSLLYECISTVITGLPNHTASIQLCVSKLRLFIEDPDQNLKYLGLLAMAKILKAQPKIVQQHKDLIMECLDDRDDSIRLRALDLISGMVSKKTLMDIVKKLILHMDTSESASYRDEVLSKIILICSHNNYQYITNFEWYITVLVEMTKFEGTRHGKQIAAQMLDVTIRVKDVRPFAVRQMATILENTHLFVGTSQSEGICEVLYAAAWIVGEFSEHLANPRSTLDCLLNPKVTALPAHIQAVFVQNLVKLYASILVTAEAEGTSDALEEVGAMLVERLPIFIQSGDLEVQERACCILQLMKYIVKLQSKGAAIADELVSLFAGDLKPVAPNAQKKVPVPEGLDLDKWIYDPPRESDDDFKDSLGFVLDPSSSPGLKGDKSPTMGKGKKHKRTKAEKEEEVEMEKRREQRRQEQLSNPHYLKPTSKPTTPSRAADENTGLASKIDVSNIPVSKLELGVSLVIDDPSLNVTSSKKDRKKKKKKRGKKGRQDDSSDDEVVVARPLVDTSMGELPEGVELSDEDNKKANKVKAAKDERFNALDQNLDAPLRDDEILPVRSHRVVIAPASVDTTEEGKQEPSKKEKKKRKKKDGAEVEEEGDGSRKKGKKKRSAKKGSLIDIAGEEEVSPVVDISVDQPSSVVVETKEETKKEGELNDLDFWLSSSSGAKPDTPKQPAATTSATIEDTAVEEAGKKKRKKGEKKPKKDAKGKKRRNKEGEEEQPSAATATTTAGSELLSLDIETPKEPVSTFKLLAEDQNIKMTYETRANMLYNGQVTVAVVFNNLTANQLVSLDFNVLDSLNTKLERAIGTGSHEGVKLPFQLPPGAANECQFTFYVQSFLMPQKLRGTTTYMVKSETGTTGEKLDFKIMLPCSAFICPVPCSQQQLANWLGGGTLCDSQAIKVKYSQTADFSSALAAIVATLHLVVVEKIDQSASLYGSSITSHHICILIKAQGETGISVNAKGSDPQLVSNLVDEIKAIV